MSRVAEQPSRPALANVMFALNMDFGNQRKDGTENRQIGQALDEAGTFGLQTLDLMGVMYYLVLHADWRSIIFEGPLDNIIGADRAGTKPRGRAKMTFIDTSKYRTLRHNWVLRPNLLSTPDQAFKGHADNVKPWNIAAKQRS